MQSWHGEDHLRDACRHTEESVTAIEGQMTQASKGDPVIVRLRSIPGIGPITAFALRHKVEDIHRFASAAHLSSYFGFGVRQRQSGETLIKGKIAKTGDTLIRKLLIQGAQVVRFRRPALLPLYFPTLAQPELMSNRRHVNKVVTALARKNLVFAYHIWKQQTTFDLDRYRERRPAPLPIAPVLSPSTPLYPPSKAAELVCEPCAA